MEILQNYYFKQVKLLLSLLPIVAQDPDFILKGGTAINLFIHDMPRLSVDIDLVYQPILQRDATLESINKKLHIIGDKILGKIPGSNVTYIPPIPSMARSLVCTNQGVQVKIEVNTIIRGTLFEASLTPSCNSIEKSFGQFVEMKVANLGDLYGGKICAALDRQHPRDLFDIKILLDTIGLTNDIKKGFLFYLISHNRPMSELLDPNMLDMKQTFVSEFQDMTTLAFSYDDYEKTRSILVKLIQASLKTEEKKFLLSFKQGTPIWELSSMPYIEDYPAVRWKLHNIQTMSVHKRGEALKKLEKILST
jgi:hypothetical protein